MKKNHQIKTTTKIEVIDGQEVVVTVCEAKEPKYKNTHGLSESAFHEVRRYYDKAKRASKWKKKNARKNVFQKSMEKQVRKDEVIVSKQ